MFASDNISVTSSGDKNIGTGGSFLHGSDLITSHSSLESVDRVDLSDDDASTIGAERFGTLPS